MYRNSVNEEEENPFADLNRRDRLQEESETRSETSTNGSRSSSPGKANNTMTSAPMPNPWAAQEPMMRPLAITDIPDRLSRRAEEDFLAEHVAKLKIIERRALEKRALRKHAPQESRRLLDKRAGSDARHALHELNRLAMTMTPRKRAPLLELMEPSDISSRDIDELIDQHQGFPCRSLSEADGTPDARAPIVSPQTNVVPSRLRSTPDAKELPIGLKNLREMAMRRLKEYADVAQAHETPKKLPKPPISKSTVKDRRSLQNFKILPGIIKANSSNIELGLGVTEPQDIPETAIHKSKESQLKMNHIWIEDKPPLQPFDIETREISNDISRDAGVIVENDDTYVRNCFSFIKIYIYTLIIIINNY